MHVVSEMAIFTNQTNEGVQAINTQTDELYIITHIRTLNGCQTITPQLCINIPPTQIIHNNNIMSLVTQIQRGGPAAESIATENNDLLLIRTVDSVCFGVEGKSGRFGRGEGAGGGNGECRC